MLSKLLQQVLLEESVSVNDVNSAIDKHSRLIINYESKVQEIANGARVVDVYAYGETKTGNEAIRAYQPYGDTASKVPSWKMFLLSGITNWEVTGQTFNEPAPGFNPNGDGSMSIVYKIASFGDENVPLSTNPENNGPKLKSDKVFKTDTERGMDKLRQQLDNPITIDQLKTQNGFKDNKIPDSTPNGPKLKDDNKEEVFKTDTERGMERLQQQLQNPRKIDLTQFNREKTNNNNEIEQLRQDLGDTSEKMTVNDLNRKLQDFNAKSEQNAQDNLYKTDTEKGMERLRQQLENPTKIDLSKFNDRRR